MVMLAPDLQATKVRPARITVIFTGQGSRTPT